MAEAFDDKSCADDVRPGFTRARPIKTCFDAQTLDQVMKLSKPQLFLWLLSLVGRS